MTLDPAALAALNSYRQTYHDWSMNPRFGPMGKQLNAELAKTAAELAKAMARLAQEAKTTENE
ncbi:hypothetical protein J2W17_003196 [Pseudomonas lini]|uniref:hypothetical protein n=1 Tax=Pseudomonas lini TaxID=163011 RepID=UPI002785729B|nr:hypothetical protein [Pseudomonas lini]MDQ0124248.1 hypothetical protein [Pseudomonas lini]